MADADQPRTGVPRRLVLGGVLGAAAAGFVGAEVVGRNDDQDVPVSAPSEAAAVSVAPSGELVAEDVQDALVSVYRRTSALARRDDLVVAHEIVDDFAYRSGQIGEGWFVDVAGVGATVESVPDKEGGIVRLTSGTEASGRAGIHLGLAQHTGSPVFTMEWRVRLDAASSPDDDYVIVVGAVDTVTSPGTGLTVDNGMYFTYDPSRHGPRWAYACARAGEVSVQDSGRRPGTQFSRLGITSDGAGLIRFWIDETEVGSTKEPVPTEEDRYGQGIEVANVTGAEPAVVEVDWFYLRRELPR